MKVCRVKVRVEPEGAYWRGQVQRLKEMEKSLRTGQHVRIHGTELVFASLEDMARALTPKRLEVLCLIRRHQPPSVRELAQIARRDLKNVLADVRALEILGLVESEGEQKERHRRAPRTDFGQIEIHIEL